MSAKMSEQINGLFPCSALSLDQRGEMFSLLSHHFEGVSREQFEHDLADKNWVIEIRREGRLVGFSTLLVCEEIFEETALTVIYSGDTIVAPEAWGSSALARTWIAAINHLRSFFPERPCHWLLLTSGFRTYRFLPVFWKQFYPRFDQVTPADRHRLLDHLAQVRYGGHYNKATGIVRFPHPQRLCGQLGAVPPGREADSNVAFFLARNPNHFLGDELACLTEIHEKNLTRAGIRMVDESK